MNTKTPKLDAAITHAGLLHRAVQCLAFSSHRNKRRPCWALVMELCIVGSTCAADICCEAGLEPDKPCSPLQ